MSSLARVDAVRARLKPERPIERGELPAQLGDFAAPIAHFGARFSAHFGKFSAHFRTQVGKFGAQFDGVVSRVSFGNHRALQGLLNSLGLGLGLLRRHCRPFGVCGNISGCPAPLIVSLPEPAGSREIVAPRRAAPGVEL
jgi:hypothetical protein